MPKLLTTGNPKIAKSTDYGFYSAVLHLAPFDLSGKNVCPDASGVCPHLCINVTGRAGIGAGSLDEIRDNVKSNAIQRARIERTAFLWRDRQGFLRQLAKEIAAHVRKAERLGLKPAIRLNGTSDLAWEANAFRVDGKTLPETFPNVQFYDYTKSHRRALASLAKGWPANYHLTFSRTESNDDACRGIVARGGVVAAVYSADVKDRVVANGLASDGDKHDLTFLAKPGVILALKAKGRAKADRSGFVLR